MNVITNTTFKSSLISVGLHASFLVMGSLAIYQSPMKSLELTGEGGRTIISLSNVSFTSKKLVSSGKVSAPVLEKSRVQTVSTKAAAVSSAAPSGTTTTAAGTSTGTGTGSGTGVGTGIGSGHDFDQGKLFSQIKTFFETRLGSTLNINVEQLIKIKVTLGKDGEILSADLVQGKLDFQSLKKVLNVAKNIPLKNFWKSTSPFPQELVIPLILTPS